MSKDRKDIYIGDGLKRVLAGMPGTLSTNVNLIADRYMAIIQHAKLPDNLTSEHLDMLRAVLAENRGHRIEGREVHGFPGLAQAALMRLYGNTQSMHLCTWLRGASYIELVALIDRLERQ